MAEFNIGSIITSNLTDAERTRSAVYIDDNPVPAGTSMIGGTRIEIDQPYVVAFIDRNPGANWMHPCRYLLINPTDQSTVSVESDRPPVFGLLPSTWRLVWQSPGLDDWRLIQIATVPPPFDSEL
ncbi:MAG: hypothetical protein ACLQVD_05200 [Capsulimonadaceae bacterium]